MTISVTTPLRDQLFIGAEWRTAEASEWIEVENPATEEPIGRIPHASDAEADAAVAAAARAFAEGPWPRMPMAERADVLERVKDGLLARAEDIARLYIEDQGGTAAFAPYTAGYIATIMSDFIERARAFDESPEDRRSPYGHAIVLREPVGPVAAIVPWNAPLILAVIKIVPALLAGCPVVMKVSPETPLASFVLAEACAEAGFPEGVISLLPGGRELGARLVADPAIRHVSFTGSTASGQAVMRAAADNMTRLTLELGGKSAAIVLDDIDPVDYLPKVFPASLLQCGQVCTTQSRILVPRRRHTEYRDALADLFRSLKVGDPTDPETLLGPLVSRAQRERTEGFVEIARGEGAEIVTGGRRPADLPRGYYYEPTLVDGVTNDMRIAREEVFGPVISLLTYEDDADAVRIANDSEFGLGNGVFTKDIDRAVAMARRLESGTVSVNSFACIMTEPWGGFKKSGLGREGGREGIEAFLEYKQIQLTDFPAS